ncbi:MAG: radical SAM protein [Candidatus Electrothrix sp. GW3-4]|uniref:B12-binding domain-containing radical SAM protein n=1 Tax=Candidatus Electrothrix sp. GW3-4 TaxID=3126740 RepID=UPI0030CC0996
MKILLVNPPNCGRSIPEERYGITSVKQIFRGEPLALEELAGNLLEHDVRILDLKAEPEDLESMLAEFQPDLVGITGLTCEANTMLFLAGQVKAHGQPLVVVGGIHASNDPAFFNQATIDYIIVGLGKRTFAELIACLLSEEEVVIPGVIATNPGGEIQVPDYRCYRYTAADIMEELPPAYDKVAQYRSHYILEKLKVTMGFVASAYGCPHRCSFCSIKGQTHGRYLTKSIAAVLREIQLLPDIPVIRLVDANTFGDIERARALAEALKDSGLRKQYLADIRSDTVVRYPDLLKSWKEAGLRAVVIGFEEIDDQRLTAMNKANRADINTEAVAVLKELGITVVGDFIIDPQYEEKDFLRLDAYLEKVQIDLPMITVMTPLPGTELYQQQQDRIINHDLDYYTLTNAVTATRLAEKEFYTFYAELIRKSHEHAKI